MNTSTTSPSSEFRLSDPSTWHYWSQSAAVIPLLNRTNDTNPTCNTPPQTAIPLDIQKQYPSLSSTIPILLNPTTLDPNLFNSLHASHPAPRLGSNGYRGNITHHIKNLLNWITLESLGGFVSPSLIFGDKPSDTIQQYQLDKQINVILDPETKQPVSSNLGVHAAENIPPNVPLITLTSHHIMFPTGLVPDVVLFSEDLSKSLTPPETNDPDRKSHSSNSAQFQELLQTLTTFAPSHLDHIYVAMRLLMERQLHNSYYQHALAILPKEYPNMDFLNKETVYLDPQHSPQQLIDHITVIQTKFYGMIESLLIPPSTANKKKVITTSFFDQFCAFFPDFTQHATSTNLKPTELFIEQFIWAYYTAVSRCFGSLSQSTNPSTQPQTCFIPLIDLLNNDSQTPNTFLHFETITPPKVPQLLHKNKKSNPTSKLPTSPTTPTSPKFTVTVFSGPNGIKQGEEVTFSYTPEQSLNPFSHPRITGDYSELVSQLQTLSLEDLFTVSTLRIPMSFNPRWLRGGKDLLYYLLFYGMFPPLHFEDSIFVHNLDLSLLEALLPGHDYFALPRTSYEASSTNKSTLYPYIMSGPFSNPPTLEPFVNPRQEALVSKLLQFPTLKSHLTLDWSGPNPVLISLCRIFALSGLPTQIIQQHLSGLPHNELNPDQSKQFTTTLLNQRSNAILDLIEQRICPKYISDDVLIKHQEIGMYNDDIQFGIDLELGLSPPPKVKNTNTAARKPTNSNTKLVGSSAGQIVPFATEAYITAFSEPIDEWNEIGAVIVLYTLMLNSLHSIISTSKSALPPQSTKEPTLYPKAMYPALWATLDQYYKALEDKDFFRASSNYYKYAKQSLISHTLSVLTTRLGLDSQRDLDIEPSQEGKAD